jgi:hypothetical protein
LDDDQTVIAQTWSGLFSWFGQQILVELVQVSTGVVELEVTSMSLELFGPFHSRNLGWIVTGLDERGLLTDVGPERRS